MKTKLVLLLFFVASYLGAQQDIYKTVFETLTKNSPELILGNKVLVVSFNDNEAEINKAEATDLEKTANVFQGAKLSGGKKGVVCVSIVPNVSLKIMLDKEGYKKTVKLLKSDLGDVDVSNIKNITFSSTGEIIYENIETSKIYESIQKLITR